MSFKTFRMGGIHPPECKLSSSAAIDVLPLPKEVMIPVSQHIGAPGEILVQKGDRVLAGQLLVESKGFVSARVHSSVSGTVAKIDTVVDASGYAKPAIFITVEGDEWVESVDRSPELKKDITLSAEEIVKRIGEMGIVGMGGATFPTHVKLSVPKGKVAEYLLINGAECEPFLTDDYRVLIERSEEFMVGVEILRRALGNVQAIIGIERNKPDAIARLTELAKGYEHITVQPLKVKYPQGGEKQLIDAILGRRVPAGKLPIDVGAVVQNVGTALAVYEAVQKNKPLVERVVTVTGPSVSQLRNVVARVGTPISALIAHAGGLPEDTTRVISGGPMMGKALRNLDAPVTKGTSGILLLTEKESKRREPSHCIRCAKCAMGCPMGLEPYLLYRLSQRQLLERLEAEDVMSCIECGSCSFTCPASLPLLDIIRQGKSRTGGMIRARAVKP